MIFNSIVQQDMEYIETQIGGSDPFRGRNVLITGCAGFLGYYFTDFFLYLIDKGVNIRSLLLLDNFILGKPAWIKEIENKYPNIHINTFDIAKDAVKTIDPHRMSDYVIHLASIASPTFYRKYPLETIDANIWGLRNLLDFYQHSNIKGFLFFSSSEIYGDPAPEFIPTPETYNGNVSCTGPRACYDEAKRFGETLCYVFSQTRSLPITIVRPFNNFGPGMNVNDKRVPADFAKSILNGEDIIIHSDGKPTRTFCYVADAISGYLKALLYGKFDCFNIGIESPEITVGELAEIYKKAGGKLLNYRGNIIFKASQDKDYLTNNPSRRCPDISKARNTLRYNPSIRVEDGVSRFLKYLKEERKQ